MRTYGLAIAAAAAIFVFSVSAFSQSVEIGPGGVRIGQARSAQCEELRRACEKRDRLRPPDIADFRR